MNKILIIDDSVFAIAVLTDILKDTYEILSASNGIEGIDLAVREIPSLILLDVEMPDMDGFEVLKNLMDNEITKSIPVIFLTGIADPEYEEKGFLNGAVDYIAKPYHNNVVKVRVKTHVELAEYRNQLEKQLNMDLLTNVYNRRGMEEYLDKEWTRAILEKRSLTYIIVDIDYFKQVNDTYGHLEGDHALQQLARILKEALPREKGCVARCGGEEFAFVLPDSSREEGQMLIDRVFLMLREKRIPNKNSIVSPILTISAGGISRIPDKNETQKDFINAADEMLYLSKTEGRNRVTWFE